MQNPKELAGPHVVVKPAGVELLPIGQGSVPMTERTEPAGVLLDLLMDVDEFYFKAIPSSSGQSRVRSLTWCESTLGPTLRGAAAAQQVPTAPL